MTSYFVVGFLDGFVAVFEQWNVDCESPRAAPVLGEPLLTHEQILLARVHVGHLDLVQEPLLAHSLRINRDSHLLQTANVFYLDLKL